MAAILITLSWLMVIMFPVMAYAVVDARRARDEARLEAKEAKYLLNLLHKKVQMRRRR